jgi:hypothetical protein
VHEDCVGEIAAEYFEGEPLSNPDQHGISLLSFRRTPERLFFVS